MAAAAKKLRLGQPTISTQLQKLEEQLGQQLFERRHRRMLLTEAGRMTLAYAEQIFKLGDELVAVVQDRLLATRVHLSIGALDSIPKEVLLELSQAAYAVRECNVSFLEGRGDELVRELLAHNLDLLLSNYAPGIAEGLRARQIAQVPVVICGAPRFRKLEQDFPRSLAGQPFVLPTRHSKLRHDVDHFLKLHGLAVETVAETQDTALASLLAREGVGLLPLPRPAAQQALERKELLLIGAPTGLQEELWLVGAARRIENPVAKELMKSFRLKD